MIKIILLILCLCCGCVKNNISLYINEEGMTIVERVKTPEGYSRKEIIGFASFVRDYPLYPMNEPIHLYNGVERLKQGNHIAVMKLPLESYDLQQCADSIMRMYAEYYYHTKQYDKIGFHFVSGFYADYTRWRNGESIVVKGNDVKWVKSNADHTTYESFVKYLKIVFTYASTLSMDKESKEIDINDITVGDIFIKGGSPGHVVMVVDVCENKEGKKAFLLAQGFMPAQQFHILDHKDGNPWYYEEDVIYPFNTLEYTFDKGSLKRLEYGCNAKDINSRG